MQRNNWKRMRPFYSPLAPLPKEYNQRKENQFLQERQRRLDNTLTNLRPLSTGSFRTTAGRTFSAYTRREVAFNQSLTRSMQLPLASSQRGW